MVMAPVVIVRGVLSVVLPLPEKLAPVSRAPPVRVKPLLFTVIAFDTVSAVVNVNVPELLDPTFS